MEVFPTAPGHHNPRLIAGCNISRWPTRTVAYQNDLVLKLLGFVIGVLLGRNLRCKTFARRHIPASCGASAALRTFCCVATTFFMSNSTTKWHPRRDQPVDNKQTMQTQQVGQQIDSSTHTRSTTNSTKPFLSVHIHPLRRWANFDRCLAAHRRAGR